MRPWRACQYRGLVHYILHTLLKMLHYGTICPRTAPIPWRAGQYSNLSGPVRLHVPRLSGCTILCGNWSSMALMAFSGFAEPMPVCRLGNRRDAQPSRQSRVLVAVIPGVSGGAASIVVGTSSMSAALGCKPDAQVHDSVQPRGCSERARGRQRLIGQCNGPFGGDGRCSPVMRQKVALVLGRVKRPRTGRRDRRQAQSGSLSLQTPLL